MAGNASVLSKRPYHLFVEKEGQKKIRANGLTDITYLSLAYAELYLTISRLVLGFTFDLHETTLEDVEVYHIRVVGYPRNHKGQGNGHGKFYVKVTGKIE